MGRGGELLSNNSGFLVWLGVVLTQEEWEQRVGEDLTCNMLPLMAHCDFPYQGEHALFIKARVWAGLRKCVCKLVPQVSGRKKK